MVCTLERVTDRSGAAVSDVEGVGQTGVLTYGKGVPFMFSIMGAEEKVITSKNIEFVYKCAVKGKVTLMTKELIYIFTK